MNIDLFTLGGYGQYVWPAFLFTFASCFILFLRTRKELKKQEELFVKEFRNVESIKIKVKRIERKTEEILSSSSV